MKFYKLAYMSNRKIVGQDPQTRMVSRGDFGLDGNYQLGYYRPIKKLDKVPVLAFEKKAKVTDIIGSIYLMNVFFLLINGRTLELFQTCRLPSFETFKIPVYKEQELFEYQLFHIAYPSHDLVDFDKSEFYTGKRGTIPSSPIVKVPDFESYMRMEMLASAFNPEQEFLCKRVIINLRACEYDLFRLTVGPALGYFISERMKDKIEELGYTGFAFKEIDEMDHDRVVAVY